MLLYIAVAGIEAFAPWLARLAFLISGILFAVIYAVIVRKLRITNRFATVGLTIAAIILMVVASYLLYRVAESILGQSEQLEAVSRALR